MKQDRLVRPNSSTPASSARSGRPVMPRSTLTALGRSPHTTHPVAEKKRMSKRNDAASIGGDSVSYTVGYRKPPTHSRFRPGQSGNPAGRRKGVRNLMTDVQRTLRVPISVKEGGRSRKISTQEGVLLVLREKGLKGDARALDRLIELASRFNNEPGEAIVETLSADDQAILTAYKAEVAADAMTSTPAEFPTRERRIKVRKLVDGNGDPCK